MTASTQDLRRAPWRSRVDLVVTFAVRNLKARFTATSLGLIWTLLVPLATVLIYSMVFSVVFRSQPPVMGSGREGVFAAWFFCGLVVWSLFSQGSQAGLASIVGMGSMLQKVYIPSYVPSMAATLGIAIEKVVESAVMLGVFLLLGNVGWTWLLYPLLAVAVAIVAASVGYILAIANVHFRDTAQIYSICLQLLFFLTPIIYPTSIVPETWNGIPLRSLLGLNPIGGFVEIARDLVYHLTLPSASTVLYCLVWTLALPGLAVLVFRRWGQDVSEAV